MGISLKTRLVKGFRDSVTATCPDYPLTDEEIELTSPPHDALGDYASAIALKLAKHIGKHPMEIAEDLANNFPKSSEVSVKAEKPGYNNFTIKKEWLQAQLPNILKAGTQWGRMGTPRKKVLVEYSSPNIAKMMHVGNFRATIVGHALDNVFRHLGYEVVNDNHLGDWGTQFGKLLVAYTLWYTPRDGSPITVPELEELYIRFNKEMKNDPSLEEDARHATVKLQQGDTEARKLWNVFCRISIAEFNHIYELFNIKFDYLHGESFYEQMLPGIIAEALEKKVAIESEGAVVIPLSDVGLPDYMIRKSDGGFMYSTTDLATIKWREENLSLDLVLYVVGDQQTLHFKQLFAAAQKLDYAKETELVHIPFGMVLGEHGRKMSTREGEAVDAMYFIQKSIEVAKKIIDEKNPSVSPAERDEIARRVAISALVYNDLSRDRESSVTFNWEQMMNLKGTSAPYLLYTYVRINGIVKKVQAEFPDDLTAQADTSLLNEPDELLLLRKLVKFPETLAEVAMSYNPHYLVHYLDELANAFHAAYDRLPVVQADEPVRRARLTLFRAVAHTMKTGMDILGMQPVERM